VISSVLPIATALVYISLTCPSAAMSVCDARKVPMPKAGSPTPKASCLQQYPQVITQLKLMARGRGYRGPVNEKTKAQSMFGELNNKLRTDLENWPAFKHCGVKFFDEDDLKSTPTVFELAVLVQTRKRIDFGPSNELISDKSYSVSGKLVIWNSGSGGGIYTALEDQKGRLCDPIIVSWCLPFSTVRATFPGDIVTIDGTIRYRKDSKNTYIDNEQIEKIQSNDFKRCVMD
jgi:hypothetical protein